MPERSPHNPLDVRLGLQSERRTAATAVAAAGATETVDLDDGSIFRLTLDANVTLTFSTPGEAGSTDAFEFTLVLTQDATGSRLVTWPASVEWAASTAPTLTTTAARTDVFRFVTANGGTKWFGETVGLDYNLA